MSSNGSTSSPLIYLERFIDPEQPSGLWWCATAEDVQTVSINAVSKAVLASWDDVGTAGRDFVMRFPYIFVAVADETQRAEIAGELHRRFPLQVLLADTKAFRGCSSVTQLRNDAGINAVDGLLYGATELPETDLLEVADVDVITPKPASRTLSGFIALDYTVGGFRSGELSVWTGKRGEGKSTFLSDLLVRSIAQGRKVCAYSGELPKEQFKRGILPQAAGPRHVDPTPDPYTGRTEYVVPADAQAKIDDWWRGKLLLTDIQRDKAHDEDNILRLFEYAYRKYGCDVFLVDNIMTAELKAERELGMYRAQSLFVNRLSNFSKRFGVHVHLVAHPRKTGNGQDLSADDVSGTGDVTNRADNVFAVCRADEAEECSARISVLKCRETGGRGNIALEFDEKSRRFYETGKTPYWKMPWEG